MMRNGSCRPDGFFLLFLLVVASSWVCSDGSSMAWLRPPSLPLVASPPSSLCYLPHLRPPRAGLQLLAMQTRRYKDDEGKSWKRVRFDSSDSSPSPRGQSWDRPFLQKTAGRIGLLKEQSGRNRVLLPKNMGNYQNLGELLSLFEDLMMRGMDQNIYSSDAVAAMNHLKRLQKQARGDKVLQRRLEAVMIKLGRVVKDGVHLLNAKNVALALNAAAYREGFDDLFDVSATRIQELMETDMSIRTQSLAMIINAFARRRMFPRNLYESIATYAQRIPPDEYNAQSVAIFLNSFSKSPFSSSPILDYLAIVTQHLDRSAWDTQSTALVLNSYARLNRREEEIFEAFVPIILSFGMSDFSSQNIANIVNAYAKVGMKEEKVLKHMKQAVLFLQSSRCDSQAVANILNAYSRLEMYDQELFAHLNKMATEISTSKFSSQAIANILNANAKVGNKDMKLFSHFSRFITSVGHAPRDASAVDEDSDNDDDSPNFSSVGKLVYDTQAIANILNAFSKLEIKDETIFNHFEGLILSTPDDKWEAQALALVLNAYAKLDLGSYEVFFRLFHVVKTMKAGNTNAQAISNIVNAMAKTELKDKELLDMLKERILDRDPSDFSAQSISSILNAYAKLEEMDEELFCFLSRITQSLPAHMFQPQAIANIVNSFIKAEIEDEKLFSFLSSLALTIDPSAYNGQAIGVIANAYIRKAEIDRPLFSFLNSVATTLSPSSFEPQNLALIANAYSRFEIFSEHLFHFIFEMILCTSFSASDFQNIAVLMTAIVKVEMFDDDPLAVDAMRYLARMLRRITPETSNPHALGNVIFAYSKFLQLVDRDGEEEELEKEDDPSSIFSHLAFLTCHLTPSELDPSSFTLLLSAFTRANYFDEELAVFFESVGVLLPLDQFDLTIMASILHTISRSSFFPTSKIPSYFSSRIKETSALAFNGQNLVLITAAYAKSDWKDELLYEHLVQVGCELPSSEWNGQSCSNYLNALARLNELELLERSRMEQAFRHLSSIICSTPVHLYEGVFDAQNIAIITNAFARMDINDRRLLEHLSLIVQQMHPDLFDAQATSNIVHAYMRLDVEEETRKYLMDFMAVVILFLDAQSDFNAQAISNIVNAFAKLDQVDVKVFEHLAFAAQLIPLEDFNAQAVANILNAYSRVQKDLSDQDCHVDIDALFLHLASAAKRIDPLLLDIQNVANVMNALARATLRDVDLVRHLFKRVAIALEEEEPMEAQAASNVMHALAVLDIRDDALVRQACQMVSRIRFLGDEDQGIANICWSSAVLQIDDQHLLEWCRRTASSRIHEMSWTCLRQVHQLLLTLELDRLLPPGVSVTQSLHDLLYADAAGEEKISLPAPSKGGGRGRAASETMSWEQLVRAAATNLVLCALNETGVTLTSNQPLVSISPSTARQALYSRFLSEVTSSRLQTDVVDHMEQLGVTCTEEFIDLSVGYSLDILMPSLGCALEVDGPFHFLLNSYERSGSTKMKHRHLEQIGYKFHAIPFWEWPKVGPSEEKLAYLRQILRNLSSSSDELSGKVAMHLKAREEFEAALLHNKSRRKAVDCGSKTYHRRERALSKVAEQREEVEDEQGGMYELSLDYSIEDAGDRKPRKKTKRSKQPVEDDEAWSPSYDPFESGLSQSRISSHDPA